MVKDDIIEKIAPDDGTEWVNSFVTVTKPDGLLRICVDPRMLNKSIIRPVHRSRTLDEILPKLSGAKYFSMLDATKGFWNVMLDLKSSRLCAFATEFGRYRYKRLPFGLSCASDIFQAKIDELTDGLDGCIGIADDLVVYGSTQEEHDTRLLQLLKKCRKSGVKLNPRKCKISLPEIPFYGLVVGQDGTKPDPKKLKALKELPMPSTVKELQSFLGMINYLSRFNPRIADVAKPLRELTRDDVAWNWFPEHSLAVNTLRNLFDSAVLQYFNPKEQVFIEADASGVGLGACLLQRDPSLECPADDPYYNLRPVAFSSKSLTDTETRYSNIERELLAVVYALERFHGYTFAQDVHVLTDHKPLESIFKKDLNSAPPRLQRLIYRSERYTFTVEYRKGIKQLISDILSRQGHHTSRDKPITGLDFKISEVAVQLNADSVQLRSVATETGKDPVLQKLCEYIITGWPTDEAEIPPELRVYRTFKESLGLMHGIIVKGDRILIPKALQEECLQQVHAAHLGYERTLSFAKSSVFWPLMSKDIMKLCTECPVCQKHGNQQQSESLKPIEIPPCAWHTLGVDNFSLDRQEYLLIVDYLTKFPIIRKTNLTAKSTIQHFKEIFSEYGIPTQIIVDRGSNFTSSDFQEFADKWQFQINFTSSEHHRANGEAERFVQTVKKLLTKAQSAGTEPELALLQLRCTPLSTQLGGNGKTSPASLLHGRVLRTTMPSVTELIHGSIPEELREKQLETKTAWTEAHTSREMEPLEIGDKVWYYVPGTKSWSEAYITGRKGHDYTLQAPSGRYIHRNRQKIKTYKGSSPLQEVARAKDKSPNQVLVRIPVQKPEAVQREEVLLPEKPPAITVPDGQSVVTDQPAVLNAETAQGSKPKRARGCPPKAPQRVAMQQSLQAPTAPPVISTRRSTRVTQQPNWLGIKK